MSSGCQYAKEYKPLIIHPSSKELFTKLIRKEKLSDTNMSKSSRGQLLQIVHLLRKSRSPSLPVLLLRNLPCFPLRVHFEGFSGCSGRARWLSGCCQGALEH